MAVIDDTPKLSQEELDSFITNVVFGKSKTPRSEVKEIVVSRLGDALLVMADDGAMFKVSKEMFVEFEFGSEEYFDDLLQECDTHITVTLKAHPDQYA